MNANKTSKWRPWIVWSIAALFPLYQFLLQGSPSVMLPELTHDLSITYVQASFITTYFFYTYILMQIPAGILVDVFGPRFLLTIGALLAGIACITFSCGKYFWIAKSSGMMMGLVCSPGVVSVFYLVSRWFEPKRFAMLVGLTETIGFAGTGIGTILLSATVLQFGWRFSVMVCGIAGIAIFFLMAFFVRNHPSDSSFISHRSQNFSFSKELLHLKLIAKTPQVWVSGFYIGFAFSVIPAFFSLWGIPFFMVKYSMGSTHAALAVAVGLAGAGLGGPLLGWYSDYIKKRKIILIVATFIAALCAWINIHASIPFGVALILNFVIGFTIGGYALAFAVIKEILPESVKGKAMGFANTLCLLIGAPILQPFIAHMMRSQTNNLNQYKVALSSLPFVLTLALIASFFIPETHCEDIDEESKSHIKK